MKFYEAVEQAEREIDWDNADAGWRDEAAAAFQRYLVVSERRSTRWRVVKTRPFGPDAESVELETDTGHWTAAIVWRDQAARDHDVARWSHEHLHWTPPGPMDFRTLPRKYGQDPFVMLPRTFLPGAVVAPYIA